MFVPLLARNGNANCPKLPEPSAVQVAAEVSDWLCAWLLGSVHEIVGFTVAAADELSQFTDTFTLYPAFASGVKSVVAVIAAT